MVQANSESVVRDSEYYKEDIVIQVENVLFRVDRGTFLQSTVFGDMFAMPPGEDVECEGSSDARPLQLEGYLAEDFRQLLRILIPKNFELPALTSAQWLSVLKLATVWDFRAARSIAIRNLDTYASGDPILRLIISKQFRILKWFVPAIDAIARRPERLGLEDVRRLEVLGDRDTVLDLVLKIAGVRENCCSKRNFISINSHITTLFDCNIHGCSKIYDGSCVVGYVPDSDLD